jgi:hypothetical protein
LCGRKELNIQDKIIEQNRLLRKQNSAVDKASPVFPTPDTMGIWPGFTRIDCRRGIKDPTVKASDRIIMDDVETDYQFNKELFSNKKEQTKQKEIIMNDGSVAQQKYVRIENSISRLYEELACFNKLLEVIEGKSTKVEPGVINQIVEPAGNSSCLLEMLNNTPERILKIADEFSALRIKLNNCLFGQEFICGRLSTKKRKTL